MEIPYGRLDARVPHQPHERLEKETGVQSNPPEMEGAAEMFEAMQKHNQEMVNAGNILAGNALKPSKLGKRIHSSGAKASVTDGPLPEALAVQPDLQRLEDPVECAGGSPLVEVHVHRLPRPVSLWEIAPRGSGPKNPQNAVEHLSRISSGSPRVRRLHRDQQRNQFPLVVRWLVPMWDGPSPLFPWGLSASWRVFKQSLDASNGCHATGNRPSASDTRTN
jgi:hypothetical protein